MHAVELIRKKRDGRPLSRDEIAFLVDGYTAGTIADYQMSAFLMACVLRGLDAAETRALTDTMLRSGTTLDLSDIPGPKVDKHSTGGVGDKVSIMLAPIVAACGVNVPMISGRGLGHTGGTLDKLESIPGFRTDLSIGEFRNVLGACGTAMIGQTDDIAPADRRLYALRDVTGTVECIPLIAGSIMSKKLAEGIDALVLDVKTGNGAFMKSADDAVTLASTLVGLGEASGVRTAAYVTDMNKPLGAAVGNWLEVRECVACLSGGKDPLTADLMELTLLLAGTMLFLAKAVGSVPDGIASARKAVSDGRALTKLEELTRLQGGDPAVLKREFPTDRPAASKTLAASRDGFVSSVDTESVGICSVLLGAGRRKLGDAVDPTAGILLRKKPGDRVDKGEPIAEIFTSTDDAAESAAQRLTRAFTLGEAPPARSLLVRTTVTSQGVSHWSVDSPPAYPHR